MKLREQISVLETVPGTEALIEQKRLEIKRLSAADTELPAWLTIAAVRSLLFWLQDEPKLNSVLRTMLESITVDLRAGVRTAMVESVRFRTSPAEAPLPEDQRNILIPRTATDAFLQIEHAAGLAEAVEMLG